MSKRWRIAIIATLLSLGLLVSFQNCSKSQFRAFQEEDLSSKLGLCEADELMDMHGKCLSAEESLLACRIKDHVIANGQSVRTYESTRVPFGQQCKSQVRTCSEGSLDGSYEAFFCQPEAYAPGGSGGGGSSPTGSACYFNGQKLSAGQTVTAYLAPTVPYGKTCSSETRTCSNGMLSGSYSYPSCAVDASTQCTPGEVALGQGNYSTAVEVGLLEVAQFCAIGTGVDPKVLLPTVGSLQFIDYVSTCGHRACVQLGYPSGKVQEIGSSRVSLICHKNADHANIPASCRQRFQQLPQMTASLFLSNAQTGEICGVPGDLDRVIASNRLHWVYNCGHRACRHHGYSTGRVVEHDANSSIFICSREELFNNLGLGTLTEVRTATTLQVATACADGGTTIAESLPTAGDVNAIRFYNTCGNRWCRANGFAKGNIAEVIGGEVRLICQKN